MYNYLHYFLSNKIIITGIPLHDELKKTEYEKNHDIKENKTMLKYKNIFNNFKELSN